MPEPLVSVVIPTYNRSYCLANAIECLRRQSHARWEAIIVDDGSSDDTREMIESRYGGEANIRYARQDNAGASAARNHGMSLAAGTTSRFSIPMTCGVPGS